MLKTLSKTTCAELGARRLCRAHDTLFDALFDAQFEV